MFDLDFESSEIQFPHHPRHKREADIIKEELRKTGLKDHFLIFSSGTTSGDLKGYALSREALFTNARAVNEHFSLSSHDVWGLSLPHFHVGGLSVLARAHLLGQDPVDLGPWHPEDWVKALIQNNVTITTVVPTQVFDLVHHTIKAPQGLRFLVVGGDHLNAELEKRAIDLGWPLVRTFGMTEICSQLASAQSPFGKLAILPIHEVKLKEDRLCLKGPSLFSFQFTFKESLKVIPSQDLCDEEGFYLTQDLARIDSGMILPLGRMDDRIKISGKLVDLNSLKETLHSYALKMGLYGKVELVLENDERLGKKLVLWRLPDVPDLPPELFSPLSFEMREKNSFDRTDLGKLKK